MDLFFITLTVTAVVAIYISLSFMFIRHLINKRVAQSGIMSGFAESNGFDFLAPKIDLMSTYASLLFPFNINGSVDNMVSYQKDDALIDMLAQKLQTGNPLFSISFMEEVEEGVKSMDPEMYNYMVGNYKNRSVEIYNYFEVIVEGRSVKRYPRTYCQVYTNPTQNYTIIKPENFWSKVLDKVGIKDIEMEYQDFNDKFQVMSTGKEEAYEILDPTVIGSIMDLKNISVVIKDDNVLIAQLGESYASDLQTSLDLAVQIANNVDEIQE